MGDLFTKGAVFHKTGRAYAPPLSSLLLVLPSQSMCDIDLVVFGDLGDYPCCRLGEELKNSALPSQGTIKVLDKATELILEVRKAFHYAYQVLTQAVVPHIDQESNGHSILGRIIRVTDEVMDHRLWVQQNWARKAMAMYPHKFSIHCNIPQPDAFCLPDTALRIAQPIRPVNATTFILADSSQRNSQETGSCQEVNKNVQ
ncbi:putative non-canonical poly(A) RNA polymerase PAPD5 [Apostichopus japonicus]|uniref:Putative non-canonical poly(A) RNA polymerase PAPD5 n=1 Tax=Stichopus japonicus TaxID=307972 RepID=A0A2G8JY44_STIJA|nr:putative non-canonical poly(A) RNA polymerase PAPD5 [Apostichopus japonicus]